MTHFAMFTQPSLPRLSWRLDPEESFSDWTLIVKTKKKTTEDDEEDSDGETTISYHHIPKTYVQDDEDAVAYHYHVHKNILAFGPRAGEYFATVFRSRMLRENQESQSIFEFDKEEADAFPHLLDHLYHDIDDDASDMTESLAIPLLRLADYFRISSLQQRILSFVEQNCPFNECYLESGLYLPLRFYEMAIVAGDGVMEEKSRKACVYAFRNLCGYDSDEAIPVEIMTRLPPDVFYEALVTKFYRTFNPIENPESGPSRLLARYLKAQESAQDCIDPDFVRNLVRKFRRDLWSVVEILKFVLNANENGGAYVFAPDIIRLCEKHIAEKWEQLTTSPRHMAVFETLPCANKCHLKWQMLRIAAIQTQGGATNPVDLVQQNDEDVSDDGSYSSFESAVQDTHITHHGEHHLPDDGKDVSYENDSSNEKRRLPADDDGKDLSRENDGTNKKRRLSDEVEEDDLRTTHYN